MKRRAFLITGGVVGGGLMVGVGGLSYVNNKIEQFSGTGMGEGHSLNAFVRISPDNIITVAVSKTEMGQGVYTSIPMLIAEELEVDLSQVKVVHPQCEGPYANLFFANMTPRDFENGLTTMEKVFSFLPNVMTGGSSSIIDSYDHMRIVGATAREMLIAAAAKDWDAKTEDCYADNGHIHNKLNGQWKYYGELAEKASKEKAPELPQLKARSEFKIVGKPSKRLDVPDKVDGTAQFGLDVRLPNMKYAAMRHPAFVAGKIVSVNNVAQVESMPGVDKVVIIDEGVAVVAKTTWHAKNAIAALDLEEKEHPELTRKDAISSLKKVLEGEPAKVWEDEGDIETVLENAEKVITSDYEVPYLAHACMEPLNCTVLVNGDKAEVWTGCQSSTFVLNGVSEGTGISKENIKTNITYLGGGFGRRSETDFVRKAAKVASNFPGTPVQLVFTREEDMKNDYYRPAVVSRLTAALGNGNILGMKKKVAGQGPLFQMMKRNIPFMPMNQEDDQMATEGMRDLPYKMDAAYTDMSCIELPVPVGTWRSVGHSQNAFFTESFMDECARELGKDPYEIRKEMLGNEPRHLDVLNKLAEMSNWKSELPEGKYRGIALHKSFGSIVGQVVEISIQDKNIKVDKVFCVIDCGKIVNPAIIESQMQSGIVYGLTAALYGEISVKDGKVVQNNFPDYQMVTMKTMPEIVVSIIDSDEYPGGVGEPGTPPIAPALTNAVFAATGDRVRSLPLARHGYRFV
ncbi:MAG: molybdopterin-dependent oxidoreductase [Bacteroidetes bacterium]|nr:molybdopterin-dependent oxidoreductase [Bacteroidota bacterium]MDA1121493.1 molybdopterin-dependent oxidoreductase [Bacteroidota bacterium]